MTENEETLEEFARKLLNDQEDIPPEFQKVLDDNFWELAE